MCNDTTRIIPANGPPISLAELKALRAMYFSIYQRMVKALISGLSPAETVAQHLIGQVPFPKWFRPIGHAHFAARLVSLDRDIMLRAPYL